MKGMDLYLYLGFFNVSLQRKNMDFMYCIKLTHRNLFIETCIVRIMSLTKIIQLGSLTDVGELNIRQNVHE